MSSESSERMAPLGGASVALRASWTTVATKTASWQQRGLLKAALVVAAALAVTGTFAAVSYPASQALVRQSGARGLRAILEHAMLDIMYDIPSRSGIKEVVVNEDVITKREAPLIVYQKEAELA